MNASHDPWARADVRLALAIGLVVGGAFAALITFAITFTWLIGTATDRPRASSATTLDPRDARIYVHEARQYFEAIEEYRKGVSVGH